MVRSAVIPAVASFVLVASALTPATGQNPARKNSSGPQLPEAPAAFDNRSNGLVDEQVHEADRRSFDRVATVDDGLGPLYNAQSCRECHQNPTSGGGSQITELRVGHLGPGRRFVNPNIPIANGATTIVGRTLVNDRAICPSAAFPDTAIQERVPDGETVRTTRISLNLLGDGFVEAVSDKTLIDLAQNQCKSTHGKVCGLAIYVPIIEATGHAAIGRFGWKNQHASLLSFSGDAYLNEIGITTALFPDEVTTLCNTVSEPNEKPGSDGLTDVDRFARFIRSSKAPAQDVTFANTPAAIRGSQLFDKVGCGLCHVRTLTTAPVGTKINGGTFTIPAALGSKIFHPFSDFLLHDVGTGDGIVVPTFEHYGRAARQMPKECSPDAFQKTQNRVRTAPLWGVRLRSRLMHDGSSQTLHDAILRHAGEADHTTGEFQKLSAREQEAMLEFLRSL
jgi:CxxC motif-containing protein (DUF1111 family)